MNVVALRGTLSRAPYPRALPSGDRLGLIDITIRAPGRATETVPVVWFQPPDQLFSLEAGASVVVVGRVRRRFFSSASGRASRTEVVAERIVHGHQRTRVLGALDGLVAALTEEPAEA